MMLTKYHFNTKALFLETRPSKSWDKTYMLSNIPLTEPSTPVSSVSADTTPGNTIRLLTNIIEQKLVLSIRQLYDVLKVSREDVLAVLKRYTGADEIVDAIKRLGFLDPVELASLIMWLTSVLELRVTSISLVEDLETRQPQFIEILIEDCGWDEWKILSRIVKKQLVSEGFNDVAGRVVLVCKQAFLTQRS